MSGLKVHPIDLSKEAWENVPPVVFKQFHIVSTNFTNIKKWTDRTDDKLQELRNKDQESEERLDGLDTSLSATQEQLQRVSDEVDAMKEQSNREFHTFTSCIKQLLDATLAYYERFVKSFDCEHLEHEHLDLKSEEHTDELEVLMVLCRHLDGHLSHIGAAFDNWTKFRHDMEEKNGFVRLKVGELQKASNLTRERLLSWRKIGEHTSELQSHHDLVCRLLLEKKNKQN